MKDWYDYLTKEFRLHKSQYKVENRVVVDCPECNTTSIVRLNHLKHKIKSLGYFECARCRKAKSLVRARKAFREKYGVGNPWKVDSIREKTKKTMVERYGVANACHIGDNHKKMVDGAKSKESREKAKNTQLKNFGAFNLSRPEIREKVNKEAWTKNARNARKNTNIEKYGVEYAINTDSSKHKLREVFTEKYGKPYVGQIKEFHKKSTDTRNKRVQEEKIKWQEQNGKICKNCNKFRKLKEYRRIKYKSDLCKPCINKAARFRYNNDPYYKLQYSIRCLPKRLQSDNSGAKCLKIFGITMDIFKQHIENQFKPGMTWDNWNYRGWHLDHIIPMSKVNVLDEDFACIIYNYKNFQPLWKEDNLSKSDKVPQIDLNNVVQPNYDKTFLNINLDDLFEIAKLPHIYKIQCIGVSDKKLRKLILAIFKK